MTGDKAKEILQQIGWNSEETLFMSFRFTPEQFQYFWCAFLYAVKEKTSEEFVSELCQQFITEQEKKRDEQIVLR